MQRISTSDNLFHDGDPIAGTLGTVVTADFLNSAQEELARAIEAFSPLNPADSGQLAKILLARRKNLIINGNFDIWQRGTLLSASTGGRYLADRFYTQSGGSTIAPQSQAFTLGQAAVPNEPSYFHRSVVASSAGAVNYSFLGHKVESVKSLAGKTAILSFWAKADANKNIAVEVQQCFGTGGLPSANVVAIGITTCALTTTWQKFAIVLSLPSLSGKTLGTDGNDNIILQWWFDAGSNFNSRTNSLGQQSGTFDIAQVQLEEGCIATQYEYRPIAYELALCQRYYETGLSRSNLLSVGANQYFFIQNYQVTKRNSGTASNIDTTNRVSHASDGHMDSASTAVPRSNTFTPWGFAAFNDSGSTITDVSGFYFIWKCDAEL